jgi:hypothetical protein
MRGNKMGSGDEQLSLFGSEEVIKKVEDKATDETAQVTPSPKLSLNKLCCDAVGGYLLEGVQSATEMSERLIVEQGANKDRFMFGKPMIYVAVCQYLDSVNHVKLVEAKEDKTDRIYQIET